MGRLQRRAAKLRADAPDCRATAVGGVITWASDVDGEVQNDQARLRGYPSSVSRKPSSSRLLLAAISRESPQRITTHQESAVATLENHPHMSVTAVSPG